MVPWPVESVESGAVPSGSAGRSPRSAEWVRRSSELRTQGCRAPRSRAARTIGSLANAEIVFSLGRVALRLSSPHCSIVQLVAEAPRLGSSRPLVGGEGCSVETSRGVYSAAGPSPQLGGPGWVRLAFTRSACVRPRSFPRVFRSLSAQGAGHEDQPLIQVSESTGFTSTRELINRDRAVL